MSGLIFPVIILALAAVFGIAVWGGLAIVVMDILSEDTPKLPSTPEVEPQNFYYKGEPFLIPNDYPFNTNNYDEHDFLDDQLKNLYNNNPSIFDKIETSEYPDRDPFTQKHTNAILSPTSPPPNEPNIKIHTDEDNDGECDRHVGCGVYDDPPPTDKDSDTKGGGKDPFVIRGTWSYFDFDAQRCSNAPNSFDYDNDGFPEHMCYWYTNGSQILFNDKNNGVLVNGENFIGNFTHIWEDSNMNIFVDEGELTPIIDPQLHLLVNYPDGRKIAENGRYIYCVGESLTYGWEFECTKPTYWQTQEWMK